MGSNVGTCRLAKAAAESASKRLNLLMSKSSVVYRILTMTPYCAVSVTVWVCCRVPLVAVTVSV